MTRLKYLLFFLFVSCGHLFYQPHEKIYTTPENFKLSYEEITFQSSDKVKLKAWIIKSQGKNKKGTILHFHGNAENRSTHFIQLAWLTKEGFDLIVPDYRGYGGSEGVPNREGIYHDSQAMVRRALEYHHKTGQGKFILWGQSLGGNIALRVAPEFQKDIDVLILDSTFESYQNISFGKLKSFFITFLISPLAYILIDDDWSANKVISKVRIPTMVLHGTGDTIVEIEYGKEIFKKLNTKKVFVEYPEMNHLQAFSKEQFRDKFIDSYNEFIKDI